MNQVSENLKLHIQPLSPIFISSGNELDIFELIPDPTDSKRFLRLDIPRILPQLSDDDKKKYWEYINKGNHLGLRSFIIQAAQNLLKQKGMDQLKSCIRYKLTSTESYRKAFKEQIASPQGEYPIMEFSRHPNSNPFIPGSSIKGALRTAVLNHLAQDFNGQPDFKFVEADLLGYLEFDERRQKNYSAIPRDPFKTLHISDIEIPETTLELAQCFNKSIKATSRGQGIPIRMESFTQIGKCFVCDVTLVTCPIVINNLKQKLSKELLVSSCKEFYKNNLQHELQKYASFIDLKIQDHFKKYILELDKDKNKFLLRIGRFSHFENMTIHKYAQKNTLSRTLYESCIPLGWAICEFKEGV